MRGLNGVLLHRIGLKVPYLQIHQLIASAGGPERAFELQLKDFSEMPGVQPRLAELLCSESAVREVESLMQKAEKAGWRWLDYLSDDYPYRLRECADAPIGFFYKGHPCWNGEGVLAVVGTRRANREACQWVELQMKSFRAAHTPIAVISGLAYGIDIAAHRACLKHALPTLAVLAHGPDDLYPAAHRQEAEQIAERGALISEFFPETPPVPRNFIRRNRIVAGMADATWVVASARKGGALVTADLACSYDRALWACPGQPWDDGMEGCNALLRDQKAQFGAEARDIALGMNWPWMESEEIFPENLGGGQQKKIHGLLRAHGSLSLDELAWALKTPLADLMEVLFSLEMEGVVQSLPGGKYRCGQ